MTGRCHCRSRGPPCGTSGCCPRREEDRGQVRRQNLSPEVASNSPGERTHRTCQHERELGWVDHSGDLGDAAVGDGEGEQGQRGAVLVPGDDAGVAVDGRRMSSCCTAGHSGAGGDFGGSERDELTVRGVDGELHFGVENFQQTLELALAGRGQERPDHFAVPLSVACRLPGGLHLPAGAAGEHLGRVGGLAEDGADLPVGDGEHVVQHERQALVGAQRVHDRQQRQAHRVAQRHKLFRSRTIVERHGEFGQLVVEWDCRARAARA